MTLALHGKSKKRRSWLLVAAAVAIAFAALAGGGTLLGGGSAKATGGTVVVKPSSVNGACQTVAVPVPCYFLFPSGWLLYNDESDQGDPTLGSFVSGPGSPLHGVGSAQISVTGSQRRNLATYQFAGTPLANITALTFRTYNPSAGNGGSASRSAYLHFNVDFNGSDTWQKRLVYVPSQNGTVLQDTWQEWDAFNSGNALWSYSGATWPVTGQPGTTLKTWNQILIDYPSARIRVTDAFLGLRVGEPYADGYTENIDALTFGTASGTTTYDFEPETPCTTVCYANAATGNDAFGGDTPASAKKTIQAAVNQVNAGGQVRVLPGIYNESAPGSTPTSLAGTYQFGLFFGSAKAGITLMGVTAGDVPISNAGSTLATINTDATNNFGTDGIFVEAANTTIQGVKIGPNLSGDNKTIEVVADNFTLRDSTTNIPGGGGSVYIDDFSGGGTVVQSYHILNNIFPDGTSIDISNGAGSTTALGAANREILGNSFNLSGSTYNAISFNGSGTGVPWFVRTVGGAVIKANSFSGGALQYIRARGTYDNTQFNWQSFWQDNTYDKAAVALVTEVPFAVRTYSYIRGPYTFTNVRRIGSTIQGEIQDGAIPFTQDGPVSHAQAGDTVLVKKGTYPESPLVDRSLTLKSESGRAVTTIVLQTGPTYTGALTLSGAGSNITVDGFTIQGHDAVGSGLASSNVYVAPGLGAVVVKNNRIRVGNTGSGTNDDDGIGLITEYGPTSVTLSLTVGGNTFEPLNAAAPRAFYINPSVDVFSFKNNTITGQFNRTALTQAKNGTVENNTITGVGPAGSRSAGFGAWGEPDPLVWGHTTFRANTITGTRRGIGLYSVNNILVEKNILNGNDDAIWSGDAGFPHLFNTIAVHRNSITSSSAFGIDNSEPVVTFDATCNWYGSSSGPGPVGPGTGDKVTAGATYSPWLVTSDLDGPCPNTAPVLTITSPAAGALFAVGAIVSLTSTYTDATPVDPYTCAIVWDDASPNSTPSAGAGGSGTCDTSHLFTAAGVYTISVTVTDGWGASDTKTVMVVVYDPSAGFVTGGGWFNSTAGFCKDAPVCSASAVGKATFGFVSKYQKGKTVPTGNTEFQFQAGNLSFSSTAYEYLVVNGQSKAQYKGVGTINGIAGYGFRVTVKDAGNSGDEFRIEIWRIATNTLVYDNGSGGIDLDTAILLGIGGGQIVIHK